METFLIFALVIVVKTSGVKAEDETKAEVADLIAVESKSGAVTIVDGPKYIAKQLGPPTKIDPQPPRAETRPPSKPPLFPDKPTQSFFADIARPFFGKFAYPSYRPAMKFPNSMYQYPRIITMPVNNKNFFVNSNPLQHVASSFEPTVSKNPQPINKTTPILMPQPLAAMPQNPVTKPQPPIIKTQPPKHNMNVQTINGIRADSVIPPKGAHKYSQPSHKTKYSASLNTTTTTTTTTTKPTTTAKILRTKRIWPKKVPKSNSTASVTEFKKNGTKVVIENYSSKTNEVDIDTSASQNSRVRYVSKEATSTTEPIKRSYRPVTRAPKHKSTTERPVSNFTTEQNDWIPIVPSQYRTMKPPSQVNQTSLRRTKRSTNLYNTIPRRNVGKSRSRPPIDQNNSPHHMSYDNIPEANKNEMMYMQTFGLIPMPTAITSTTTLTADRKKVIINKPKRHHYPNNYAYTSSHTPYTLYDLPADESQHKPRYITKIKHHHHHHHHKYVKTVEKPIKVPYKVEVPKPYGIPVEKKVPVPVEKIKVVERPMPYPVTVEKKVPFPIGIKVPQPVPVKVIEKEYIPKPYPIYHRIPVVKEMKVEVPVPQPYPVERKIPYPVEIKVPYAVDRPVPVPVEVEKKVPYPVHVKVFVPQPYPVETKVPYPVYVKEPVEVIKHVKVNVPVPQPYPVQVKVPYPVEKKVPYPVTVEKRVPVPYEVFVPQRVEVEKKVPVYVPSPYPVEQRIPYPVRVPYPVKVPVKVPYEVPVYIHHPVQMVEYNMSSQSPLVNTASSVTVHGTPQFTQDLSGYASTQGYSPEHQWASRNDEIAAESQVSTQASDSVLYADVKRPTRALSTDTQPGSNDIEVAVSKPTSFQVRPDIKVTTLTPSGFTRSPENEGNNASTDVVSRILETTTVVSAA